MPNVYDAVRVLDIEALQTQTPADLIPFLPVLVEQAERQPALRSVLDRVPAQANFVLRLHEIVRQPMQTDDRLLITNFDFSKQSLDYRIGIVFQLIRDQTAHSILSDKLFQEEIAAIVAVALLHSIQIVPLSELIKAFLIQRTGIELCYRILINCHDLFTALIETMVLLFLSEPEFAKTIETLLIRAAGLNSLTSFTIRNLLVKHQAAPHLTLQITSTLNDDIEFISEILQQRTIGAVRFLACLKSNSPSAITSRAHLSNQRAAQANGPLALKLLDRFLRHLQDLLAKVKAEQLSDAIAAVQATLTIRAACQLQAIIQIVFPRDLTTAVLEVMSCRRLLVANRNLADFCLCFLFQCSSLFKAISTEHVGNILRSVTTSSLFKQVALGSLNGERSMGSLISDCVGVPVRLLAGHVEKLSDLIISDVSPKLTDILFDAANDMFGIVYSVLNAPLFTKKLANNAVLRDRFKDCLSNLLADPVYNPNWISVLQRSAELCVNICCQSNKLLRAQPLFSENRIVQLISNAMKPRLLNQASEQCSNPATVILVAYYALYYNRIAQKRTADGVIPFRYSDSILDSVPIFKVMRCLGRSSSMFASLQPLLQDLLYESRCELLHSDHDLCSLVPDRIGLSRDKPNDSHRISAHYLEYLLSLPDEKSVSLSSEVLGWIPRLLELDEQLQPYLFVCFLELWRRWCRVLGRVSFYFDALTYFSSSPVSTATLTQDPARALSISDRVWSSPSLVEIFLSVLRVIRIRHERLSIQSRVPDKQRLFHSNAVIAKLFERSCSIPNDNVKSAIFRFTDGEFRRSPNLLQYSLFQGLPLTILPKLVIGVSSLEGAIAHLPELLSRDYEEEQVFALALLSELSLVYQSRTRDLCDSVLKRFSDETVDSIVPYIIVLRRSLPALIQIARSHPFLLTEVIRLLSILRPAPGFERSEIQLADEVDRAFLAILDHMETAR